MGPESKLYIYLFIIINISFCPTEPGQHIEGTVAQEGNVDVVTQCQKPQRISQQGCEEYLPL